MKLRPYPAYKESGLPWLGRVPKHWECLPHRAIFEEIIEQGHINEPLLSVTIGRGIIRQEDLLAESSKKDSSNIDKSKYKLVEPGDIAYNKMRAWQGAVGVSKYQGIVSPAYIVQRLRGELRPEYFHYLFRTPGFAKEAERWSYGITSDQWSLRPQHFKMIYSCLPPQDEQDAIIRFLHSFDAKVRRFIRNRRRLIEVLNEQKQAIINQAVTRGLDPDVPLKSSGIDWLGDIPEHWVIKRLRHLIDGRLVNGLFKKKDQYGSGVPLVNVFDVYRDDFCVDPSTIDRVQVTESEKATYEVQAGDMFFVRSSIKLEGTGRSAFLSTCAEPIVFECHLVRARPLDTVIHSRYLANYLNSVTVRNYLVSRANTVTISTIPQGVLKDIPVAFPPSKTQQNEILKAIDRQLHPMAEGIDRAQREIDLIHEYRTCLISDVVTGKVDVRHLAPPPGSEDSEEMAEALELLAEDPADAMLDEEESINESD